MRDEEVICARLIAPTPDVLSLRPLQLPPSLFPRPTLPYLVAVAEELLPTAVLVSFYVPIKSKL